ncbi:MAG: sulfide dehydrogenase [flavocytochrome c] flavoprotein chain [Methyloprofundus sp.]|nr:MAG: sulfide dehydrogenase [flavocytochrome c] flavoprotein chain [Methyloprofundus sp.]
MTQINRREFIKLTSATAALAVTPSMLRAQEGSFEARVVVVGGGFAGATLAKYLRLWSNGQIQVTMIDKNPDHVSCVLSNLILNDRLQLADITQSYTPLEENYGVIVEQGEVTDVSGTDVKTVHLASGGSIECDYVALAPGIEFIDVDGLKEGASNNFDQIPHAWIAGEQTNLLRDQLHAMQSGDTFIMTVPLSPYRCPPDPYERACVVADYIKRVKGTGTVIVLDPHAGITIEQETFEAAFNGLYKDIVIYVPNAVLEGVVIKDNGDKVAMTSAGTFVGKVLNVIPTHKAGSIVENLGLLPADPNKRFAPVHHASYESTIKSGIYVIGDSNDSGQPKSGHMANAQAKVCADAIIRTIAGKSSNKDFVHDPARLATIKTNSACYSPITYDEASWLTAVFAYETLGNSMQLVGDSFASSHSPHWSNDNFQDMFDWANSLFSNTFG